MPGSLKRTRSLWNGSDMSALETSLNSFGVTRSLLSTEQVENLDRNGFVALEGALDEVALREVSRRVDELVATEGGRAGTEFKQEAGTDRLANLVDKGAVFDNCWNYPLQLAAVAHVLSWREFRLTSLNTRSALPNKGRQGLHVDWAEGSRPGTIKFATLSGCSMILPRRTGLHVPCRVLTGLGASQRT